MSSDVTKLLVDWQGGDEQALDRLLPMVYDELHRLARGVMRRERPAHTLQPTALIHEAFLRLVDQDRVHWRSRAHFIGVAAHLMRRVTLKYARKHQAAKRGGGAIRVTLGDRESRSTVPEAEDLLALDEALRQLQRIDSRQAQIVELKFFGGLESREMEEVLGVSRSTIDREWRTARAWLKRALSQPPP